MTVAAAREPVALNFANDKARKVEAEADEARTLAEQYAAAMVEASTAEAAMRETRAILRQMIARWLLELPAEVAGIGNQDELHARLSALAHDGLRELSAWLATRGAELRGEPASEVDPLVSHGGAAYCERAARAAAPRPRLTVSQWADQKRWLSQKGSGEPGKWSTDRNPALREIMDCLSLGSDVRRIVIMKPSQIGVTEGPCINFIGYVMDHAPAPIMVLLPTLENRDKWVTQKLNPLLTETPAVAELFDARAQRDATNSKDTKDFPGGVLFLAGGNSPNSYAQVSARYVILDDLDRFPEEVGAEGHPVALARGRAKGFSRYKLLLISTPTIKEASHIEAEYEKSDQRRYHVPCPHCGQYQHLVWKNLKWALVDGQVQKAWYVCSECGSLIEEHHKPEMLAAGRWIAARPEVRTRGYHLNGLYAPIGLGKSWPELAQEWLDAQKDPIALKTFVNTELAETWEDPGRKKIADSKKLLSRVEDYRARTAPPGCLLITVGVDTQDNRLSVQLVGWGRAKRWFVLDWFEIPGDPGRPEVWETLTEILNTPIRNAYGRDLAIRACAIDTGGHHGDDVKAYSVSRKARCHVMAIAGSRHRMPRVLGKPAKSEFTVRGRPDRKSADLYQVGTEVAKDRLYNDLAGDTDKPPEERHGHFSADLPEEYFDQLTSEVYDPEKNGYTKRRGRRNEGLDTWVYAYAAAHNPHVGLNKMTAPAWDKLERVLEAPGQAPQGEQEEGAPPAPPAAEQKPAAPKRESPRPSGAMNQGGNSGGFY